MMKPEEMEKKMKKVLEKELKGYKYDVIIAYSDGKIEKGKGAKAIATSVTNVDLEKEPFLIAHSLFRVMQVTFSSWMEKIYGTQSMKREAPRQDHGQQYG